MGKNLNFKQYQRGTRTQTVEDTFINGMSYNNAPLAEGYSRILLNYDITADGSLRPRPGFVKKDLAVKLDKKTHKYVLSSATVADELGNSYQHTVLGSPTEPNLYQVVQPLDTNAEPTQGELIPTAAPGDTTTFELSDMDVVQYKTDKPDSIHNMPIDKTNKTVQDVVGCRAFNNDFYYFQGQHLCHAGHLLTKDATVDTDAEYGFVSQRVEPKQCTPGEATATGFNMLSANPYTFEDTFGHGTTGFKALGLMAYEDEACTRPVTIVKEGQKVWLRCFVEWPADTRSSSSSIVNSTTPEIYEWIISAGASSIKLCNLDLEFVFEQLVGNEWTEVGRTTTRHAVDKSTSKNWWFARDPNPGLDLGYPLFEDVTKVAVEATKANTTYRCLVYTHMGRICTADSTDRLPALYNSTSSPTTLYMSTILATYNWTDQLNVNRELKTYSLAKASGMVYWKDRLVLWGVPENKTMLFISDVQNPGYFPYPHNTDAFTDPIVAAVPLLDYLVIFTTTEVYTMQYDAANMVFIRNCIQRNLRLEPWDRHLIQPVKNMLFFKSGNYYYMIVPKAQSTTGELTIAPITRPITNLFDNFKNTVYNLMEKVYNYDKELNLIHYYNFLDYEDIVNNYVFSIGHRYVNFMVVYNSVGRTWSLRVIETPGVILPIKLDATQRGVYGVVAGDTFRELGYSTKTLKDDYGAFVQNYQYYDSGFREHNSNLKKRYREYQLIVNNLGQCEQEFHTGFYIDNDTREALFECVVTPIDTVTSLGSPIQEYIIDTVPMNTQSIPSTTLLTTAPGTFKIGHSMFPEVSTFKLRFHTSGKGYAPRMALYTKDFRDYALLSNSYVYRTLYSR